MIRRIFQGSGPAIIVAILSVIFAFGCTLATDTDLGKRPPEPAICDEGTKRCSTNNQRIEQCTCDDENVCKFQPFEGCTDNEQCTAGMVDATCGAACPGGGFQQYYARDADGDGYAQAETEVLTCTPPNGNYRISNELQSIPDCNDNDSDTNPAQADVPGNSTDENCDGLLNCYVDADQDSFVASDNGLALTENANVAACTISDGYASSSGATLDCNDDNDNINPDATETCNGVDDNCNGAPDTGPQQDAELVSPCHAIGEDCLFDDTCTTNACTTGCTGSSCGICSDLESCADPGICVPEEEVDCESYCKLYMKASEVHAEDACEFFVPAQIRDCPPDGCPPMISEELCLEACQGALDGLGGSLPMQPGTINDENTDFTLGCRANHFVNAIKDNDADECRRGTLTMGGTCGSRANYGQCVEGSDPSKPCAFGSVCASLDGGVEDYEFCSPQCGYDISGSSQPVSNRASCPTLYASGTAPEDINVSPACVMNESNTVRVDGNEITTSSIRCLYGCLDEDADCSLQGVSPTDTANEDLTYACMGYALAGPVFEYTCLADGEKAPGFATDPPRYCTNPISSVGIDYNEDTNTLQGNSPTTTLTELNDHANVADIASALGISKCYRPEKEDSGPEDLCHNLEGMGCDDCLIEFRECLIDNDGACNGTQIPGLSADCTTTEGSADLASADCADCMKTDGSHCLETVENCSGIPQEFFTVNSTIP